MILNLTCVGGLIALGWVASKLHTIASKKWIPMSDHTNTVNEVVANLKKQTEERRWQVIN